MGKRAVPRATAQTLISSSTLCESYESRADAAPAMFGGWYGQVNPLIKINAFGYTQSMAEHALIALPVRRRTDACCENVEKPSLTKRQTSKLAGQLKAVGDATRLGMLDLLAQQADPICVCDITPFFDQLQPTISHHLRLLREAGLIDTEKRGLWAYYWATAEGRNILETIRQLV